MTQQHECQGCQHHNSCEDIYRRLGHSDTSSVAVKVCIAFILPLIAFVVSSLQTPVYEASATVSIDQKAFGLSINPAKGRMETTE